MNSTQKFRNGLLISGGIISLILATIGLFIALLPTTPFLLSSAACFIRSSERLYRWLTGHRIFGRYIKNYREHRAASRNSKVVSLLLLWLTIGYTALIVVDHWIIRFVLFVIAVGVTVHLIRLKTLPPDSPGREVAEDSDSDS